MCLRDIVKGEVNEENVALIVTGTKRDFEDVIKKYVNSESIHHAEQDAPEIYDDTDARAHEILERLWKQGRIHQPRRVSSAYEDDRTASVLPSYARHWFKLSPLSPLEYLWPF